MGEDALGSTAARAHGEAAFSQNLALTVLCVPYSLYGGTERARVLRRRMGNGAIWSVALRKLAGCVTQLTQSKATRAPVFLFFFFTLGLEMSDTKVYEP